MTPSIPLPSHYKPRICSGSIAFISAARRSALLAPVAFFAVAGSIQAASQTWVESTDSNWATTTNWVGGAAPGAITGTTNDTATFNSAITTFGGLANPVVIDAGRRIGNITFDTSAGAYVIGANAGNTLTLSAQSGVTNAVSITAAVANSQVIAAPVTFTQPSSQSDAYGFTNNASSSAVTLSLTGAVSVSNTTRGYALILGGSNTGANIISGNITYTVTTASGFVPLTKSGTGTWILSGANTFSNTSLFNTTASGIQINGGVLSARNNTALGTNATANTARVAINNTGTLELASGITLDNGLSLDLNNGGTIQSSGTNTTNARINVSTAATGVTLQTVNAADVFTAGNAANDFTGGTAGTTVTTIAGPGTVVLAQASNYAGGISINAGTLRLGSSTAIGAATTARVAFGSGSTGILQLNGNSLTLVSLSTNATAGTTAVENGVAGTTTLTLNNATANTFAGVIQNGAAGTLALTKQGVGALTLSGANTYSGATAITAGTLNVANTTGSATGTSTVTLTGATNLTGNGFITGTLTTSGTSVFTPGVVTAGSAGSGVLTLASGAGSTLTLTAGTTLNFGLDASNPLANYISSTNLTLPTGGSGNQLTLNLYTPGTSTPFAAAGTYDLFQYTGTLTGPGTLSTAFTFGTSIAGFTPTFGTAGGFLQLTLSQAGISATWTNGGGTGNWNNTANWSGGYVPHAFQDTAVFGATAPGTVNLDIGETIGSVVFNNSGSAFTVSSTNASVLTLDNGGNGSAISATGTHAISTAIVLNDNLTVAPIAASSVALSGGIAESGGARSVTVNGAGVLALSGTNTYTGGTTIRGGGTLNFTTGSLGAGGVNFNNGNLQYAGGNTDDISTQTVSLAGNATIDTNGNNVTLANAIGNAGTGALTKTGAGTLTLSGVNTYTGATTISAGTLSVSSNANLGEPATGAGITLNGGTLASTATFALDNAGANNRPLAMSSSGGTIDTATATTLTLSGVITGSTGTFTKTGSGTLLLAGNNTGTFSSPITIAAGIISLGVGANGNNGLGTGTVTFTGGTLNSNAQGAGDPGGGGYGFTNNFVVASGNTGTLNLPFRGLFSGSLTGGGTFNVNVDGTRSDFTGNYSAFTGQINIGHSAATGDFRVDNLNGFGTARINIGSGASLYDINNFGAGGATFSVGEITGAGTLSGGPTAGRTLTWSVGGANTNAQFDGIIQNNTGPTAITKVGTGSWTLTGANTYTGVTTVSGGTLVVSGALSATTAVSASGSTLQLGTANVLNDASTVALGGVGGGGIFATAGLSETVGALTLAVGTSSIDFGSGASVLHFADSSASAWTGTLSITNWSGSDAGAGTDQLFFGSTGGGLTAPQLSQIQFVNPDGFAAGTYGATILSSGEVVALVPEPGVAVSLLGGIGLLIGLRRRRSA